MRVPRSPAVAVLVALVASLGLSACGGDGGPDARERLASSVGTTLDAGSAAFTMDARIRTGPDTAPAAEMSFASRGAADLGTGASRMETDLPGVGLSITMLFDTDTVFVRMPALLTGGEAVWIRRPVDSIPDGGVGSGAATADFAGSPARALEALRDVRGGIERLGPDSVRGSAVEGYGFSVPAGALWQGPGEPPRALREREVPATAWLDGRDRVRRLTLEMDLATAMAAAREAVGDSVAPQGRRMLEALGADGEGRVAVTLELFDFGTEVDARPPDTARVVDADSAGLRMLRRQLDPPGAFGPDTGGGG